MTTNSPQYNKRLSRIQARARRMSERAGMTEQFRSGLEFKIGKIMMDQGIEYAFEDKRYKMRWTPIPKAHTYNPDFVIERPDGTLVVIESKGRFMPDDMDKHLALREQHPGVKVFFVFQDSKKWHRKAVKMNYGVWCAKHGFTYCDFREFPRVIKEWIK